MKQLPLLMKNIYQSLSTKEKIKHGSLFLLTFFSMTVTIMLTSSKPTWAGQWLDGLFFSVPLIIILTAHEMGHYLNAHAYGVYATLPFFIPLPILSPIGTMGAFISMKGVVPDKRSLFDIAFWGPAMSFLLSVPVFIIGMAMSEVVQIPEGVSYYIFGDSLLTWLVGKFMFDLPAGHEVMIHPLGFAGWTGLLVTAINLLPVGQLDGGHIAYAMLGKKQKQLAYLLVLFIVLLSFQYSGWILWVVIFIIMGISHPPIEKNYSLDTPLDPVRKKMGLASLVVFLVTFVPAPISMPENDFAPAPAIEEDSSQWNAWQQNLSIKFLKT